MSDINEIRKKLADGRGCVVLGREEGVFLLRMVDALCARGTCPCPPKKACLESTALECNDAEISDAECFRCMEAWANEQANEVRQ